MTYLRISGLRKSFGDVVAVDGVDLELAQGAFLALVGPSGCGKTTLLRAIAGFERPEAGCIELGGRTLVDEQHSLPPERRRVGLVFQEYVLFPHLSVAANVGFGVQKRQGRKQKVEAMLELVGLGGLGNRMPHELSGGQQQRVALARTLAAEPELVLLDEPFSNLDPTLRARVRTEVWQILREFGATAIVVTHDQEEALSIPGQVGVMLNGRVRQVGPPADIYTSPADHDVAEFIGDANFMRGTRRGAVITSTLGDIPAPEDGGPDGDVLVMVRPEHLTLDESSSVTGQIVDTEFYGHDQVLRMVLDDGEPVRLRLVTGEPFFPGERHGVRLAGPVRVYLPEVGATVIGASAVTTPEDDATSA